MPYSVAILTISDKGSRGERVDESGKIIEEILHKQGYSIVHYTIIPDEESKIIEALIHACDEKKATLVLTTGGTGFSIRDVTPEATRKVIEKDVPGIPEAMRQYSLTITPKAMLSRATAGIRGLSLIVNLPGSPKAVRESLAYIIEPLQHGLDILTGSASECART